MDMLRTENSTTVRSNEDSAQPSPQPEVGREVLPDQTLQASWLRLDWRMRLLRMAMRGLSRTSPRLAVALFDRLWFSAPRTRPRADAMRWLDSADALDVRVHGQRVRAWSRGRGPAILLVHGWGGNAGQMQPLADALLEAGYRVVVFDAPAHGASGPSRLGGRRVTMLEIADALRVVAAAAGPVAGLVAHSGGCTATTLALRDGWHGPQRIVFVAPFALPSAAIEPFGAQIGASPAVVARFREDVERRLGRPWTDFDIPGLASQRAVPPLLVVHDRDDHEVPSFHGQAVARAWPHAGLFETRTLGHRRPLRDDPVARQIQRFFVPLRPSDRRAAPAQSRDELDRAFDLAGCARR